MKKTFYTFTAFIITSFLLLGGLLNFLTHDYLHKVTEDNVIHELEILSTITKGALAQNDYERIEEQVFLLGEKDPNIITISITLGNDSPIVEFSRKTKTDNIIQHSHIESTPVGRDITFEIIYNLTEHRQEAHKVAVIFFIISSCFAVVFIFSLWMIIQRLAIIPMQMEITERKQVEASLIESEKKFRDLADSLPQVVFETDATGRITYTNKNAYDLFKYTEDDLNNGLNAIQVIIPEDRDRALKTMGDVLNGIKTDGVEYTAYRQDGTTFPVVIHSNPIIHNGQPIGLRGLIIDISKQKKMELDLNRRALAIDHSSDTIVIADTKENITYVNPAFEKTTGYSSKETVGQNQSLLKSQKHDKSFYKEIWETISNGSTWSGRLVNKKKDGTQYTEDATISPIFSDKGKIVNYVAVKRDISDQLKLEARLQQAQKMESIGTLAGGIAHDFNNILFPILGYTEMLLEDISEDNLWRANINEVYKGALRAKDLVKQILTFSRQDTSDRKLMEIQPVIKEAFKLIRSTIPATIQIKLDLNPDCGVIKADPTKIHQIVMNLATNAYHAMEEDGGKLKVSLKERKLGKDDVAHLEIIPGVYACLTIADTGKGMDKALIKKIFDPFFTTKQEGKGTGMGLSVVHGIVKSTGGDIAVFSTPCKGTKFHVYLPVVNSSCKEQNIQANEPVQIGNESILLVDDEENIISMQKQMLERLGYKVTCSTKSLEALETFRAAPDKFDMVISDMAMPNMSGDKLLAELIKIRPDIPLLLCTGFSETMSKERATSLGAKGFLLKPVITKELSQKIREILDKN